MSTLTMELDRYLAIRRNLGYRLSTDERVLRRFTTFADSQQKPHVNTNLFLHWQESFGSASKHTWARRLGIVRVFAHWLHCLDPNHEVPPQSLLPVRTKRPHPYIYSEDEIRRIVETAAELPSINGIRALTMSTLFGLIAVTGLRIAEALSLDADDVDLINGVITLRRGKNDNARLLPVTDCTRERLKAYARERDRLLGKPSTAFFVADQGTRLTDGGARYNFASVCQSIGLRRQQKFGRHGHGPRIHDLRHTFAVRTLLDWYRNGLDPAREMIKLTTYLGHYNPAMTPMWKDFTFALRTLRKSPAFAAVAVASLALGIGANTAIFSFVNAILLKRLAVPEPERLVTFAEIYRGETSGKVWRMITVEQLAKRDPVFAGLFGWLGRPVSFSTGDKAQWVMSELVTGQYFQTLQVKPAIGRLLTDYDVRNAKADPVCVLSYSLWQRELAGDPGVIGRSVFLNGHAYRVLGVTARGFYGAELEHRFDLQIPATRIADFMPAFGDATGVDWLKTLSWLTPMARLKPGITRIEAQGQTQRVLRQIEIENNGGHTPDKQLDLRLENGSRGFNTMRSEFGRPVLVLMAVVALVLLVACANLANLLFARAQTRAKEFAVRMSVGASRARLIRQLLIESLVLAACGGITGIIVSFWIARTLVFFLNAGRSTVSALHVTSDLNVLAFSITLSFATAILFGLVPAWQATQPDLLPGLKQERAGRGRLSRVLLRRSLVVIQIALSLVVVFAAGLLTRTLRSLEQLI